MYYDARLKQCMFPVLVHTHLRSSDTTQFATWLSEVIERDVQAGLMEVVTFSDLQERAKTGWNSPGWAIADHATDATVNSILAEMRRQGLILKS
jgi:hypothetical protein